MLTRKEEKDIISKLPELVQIGCLGFTNKCSVIIDGNEVQLTPKEYNLLLLLAKNSGYFVSKEKILKDVWGLDFDPQSGVQSVYVSFIRNKIKKTKTQKIIIHSEPETGYALIFNNP